MSAIPSGVTFVLDILTHVSILWFFLVILFVTFGSTMEEERYTSVYEYQLGDPLVESLKDVSGLESIADQLETIRDTEIEQSPNSYIVVVGVVVGILFVTTLVGMLLTLQLGFGINVLPIYGWILLESTGVLILVGVSQFIFQRFIVHNYVPITSNAILEETWNELKQNLQKK